MLNLNQYIDKLFTNVGALDFDLKQILEKELLEKYDYRISIKNLKFVETSSHTMFFSSTRINSAYNVPLNNIIFSKSNLSNISLTLSTSKIKMNNYSSPEYIDFFGKRMKSFPTAMYKNTYVYCMGKIPLERLEQIRKWKELCYMQELINGTEIITNKNNLGDINALSRRLSYYKDITLPLEKKLLFRNSVYNSQIEALIDSAQNKKHVNLSDQVNYAQTKLINNVYQGDIKHFYLSLENISSQLFLSKIGKDSFWMEIFCGNMSHYIQDSLFLKRNGKQLEKVPNTLLRQFKLKEIISLVRRNVWVLNTKFSLLLLNVYGLQTFGGRFQKEYMKEFIMNFLQYIKEECPLYSNMLINKLQGVIFLDFSSMIIVKKGGRKLCDYNVLLSEPLKIDDGFIHKLYHKDIVEIEKDTKDYLETKRK